MKLVFIAGKYSAEDLNGEYRNIDAAHRMALEFAKRKIGFLCPIIHTAHFNRFLRREDPGDEWWYDSTLEMLKRCDAIFLLEGWQFSRGARNEVDWAEDNNYPMFDNLDKLDAWYHNREGK